MPGQLYASDGCRNRLPFVRLSAFVFKIVSQGASAISFQSEGAIMPRRTIRLSADADERLQATAKVRGYANPSVFLRAAIDHELTGREDAIIGAEERLATSLDQMSREITRLDRSQQALFALVDSLAKILLTCIPEPDGHALAAAVARAQGRHARLLKSAGQAMGDDSRLAMQELVKHGER
jgi:predicted DNA-binding protein